MIEIIILFKLCKHLGDRARDKGRGAIGYQLMLILFWFGGELGTAFLTGIMLVLVYGDQYEHYLLLAYIAGIMGAAVGAGLAFQIVSGLPEAGVDELAEWDSEDDFR